MNSNQKVALVVGVAAFVVLGLWPPSSHGWFDYSIFYRPAGSWPIEWPTLGVVWALVAVVTGAAVFLLAKTGR